MGEEIMEEEAGQRIEGEAGKKIDGEAGKSGWLEDRRRE